MTITVSSLKKVKNSVIGNPLAKVKLARQEIFVSTLIDCLNPPIPDLKPSSIPEDNNSSPPKPSRIPDGYKSSLDALRIEAAHVIASIAYGSEEALSVLLRHNTHGAFLYAISHFTPTDSPALRAAFVRAFRALATSIADVVGPSLWGLRPENSMIRKEARQALDHIFHIESLDVYLPLLSPSPLISPSPSNSVTASIAQMLAGTVRCSPHRQAVREWLPPAERQCEITSRRGWEKPSALSANAASPWICKRLLSALGDPGNEKDTKLTEALLSALAALAQENLTIASFLVRTGPDRDQPPISHVLAFTKSRSVDVQLAACLCLTHTFRASASSPSGSTHRHHPSSSPHHISTSPHPHLSPSSSLAPIPLSSFPSLEETGTRTVMNVINRIITLPPSQGALAPDSVQSKTKACFILYYLVKDDAALCSEAFERGCLEHIAALIHSINPLEPAPPEWEEHEPESVSCLREAALTTLASLALFSDDIRRRITDELRLLPCISRALRASRHVGTRYAAAQCVRSISRAVSVLRTNIVDSGLGTDVLRVVLGRGLNGKFGVGLHLPGSNEGSLGWKGKQTGAAREMEQCLDGDRGSEIDFESGHKGSRIELFLGEDRRVISAALAAVCNIVMDFSPLRPDYIEEGLIPRLVLILKESGDPGLQLSSLWALKNLVRKTSVQTKVDVMSHLGWFYLVDLLGHSDVDIQEQAFNILRNLAENDEGIEMVFREVGPQVLGQIAEALTSCNENVVLQAAYLLGNLCNGTPGHQASVFSYPRLLSALHHCLAESGTEVRRPVVSAIFELARADPTRRKDMMEVGIVGTLKRLVEWSGHRSAGGHGGGVYGAGYSGGGMSPTSGSASHPHSHWGGRRTSMSMGVGGSGSASIGSWGPHWTSTAGGHYGHGNTQGHGPSTSYSIGDGIGMENDRGVLDMARAALNLLEYGDGSTL